MEGSHELETGNYIGLGCISEGCIGRSWSSWEQVGDGKVRVRQRKKGEKEVIGDLVAKVRTFLYGFP